MSTTGLTQKLVPVNMEQEKRRFLFDPEYNPQFEYAHDFEEDALSHHGDVSTELLTTAKYILNKVLKTWENDEDYIEQTEGGVLSQSEVEQAIRLYLQRHHLENIVTVNYSSKFLARTSVLGNTLNIRTPIHYRAQGMLGMLEHEIGVHILRRLNDEKQPWRGQRGKYQLHSYLPTEEGLAVLHSNAIREDKHLWFPALSYYTVYLSQQMSFAQLYKELKPFVKEPERRWGICLKAKRGLHDTSLPGGYTKNQVYLTGVVETLRWLRANDFDARPLYLGKIAYQDVALAQSLATAGVEEILVPQLVHNREWYRDQLLQIAHENKLPI